MSYARFGIYYVPPAGDLASLGAKWLGWDILTGLAVEPLAIAGRKAVTEAPRKYGFHATLKPPFRLADGVDQNALEHAVEVLARSRPPAQCAGLELSSMGRFLALTPVGDPGALNAIAAACVTDLDRFRAPPDAAELARRRGKGLPPHLERNLTRWGYPHVLDAFRFHMTLTGRVAASESAAWAGILKSLLPNPPTPFVMSDIALVGARADGRFALIRRFELTG